MRAWTAMMKRSIRNEQAKFDLNISSLIWENWKCKFCVGLFISKNAIQSIKAVPRQSIPFPRCVCLWRLAWRVWCVLCAFAHCCAPRWLVLFSCWFLETRHNEEWSDWAAAPGSHWWKWLRSKDDITKKMTLQKTLHVFQVKKNYNNY